MPQISLNKKVRRVLRWYKIERIMLWIIVILGSILTVMGFFLFFCIYVPSIILPIMGAIIIGFAVDKLITGKIAYQMASYIKQIDEKKR